MRWSPARAGLAELTARLREYDDPEGRRGGDLGAVAIACEAPDAAMSGGRARRRLVQQVVGPATDGQPMLLRAGHRGASGLVLPLEEPARAPSHCIALNDDGSMR